MSVNQNSTSHETHTQYRGHIMLNVVVLSRLSFCFFSAPPPLFNLSKWELDVLSKQLLKLFTYSLIWWSNKPLKVGQLSQRTLQQHVVFGNTLSNQSWFSLAVFTALAAYAQIYIQDKSHGIFWLNIVLSIIWIKFDYHMSLNFGTSHINWPLLHNIGNKQANTHIFQRHMYIIR